MRYILLFAFVGMTSFVFGQSGTFWSQGTFGDWNSAGMWTQLAGGTDVDGIPDADDIVRVGVASDITISGNESCSELYIGDDGNGPTFFTIDAGASLAVGGTMEIGDSADFCDIEIAINGTLQVNGIFYVNLTGFTNPWIDINIAQGGLLDINYASNNRIYVYQLADNAVITVDGTLDCAGSFLNYVKQGTDFQINIGTNGLLKVDKNWTQRAYDAGTKITTNIRGGKFDLGGYAYFSLSGAAAADNKIDMNYTSIPEMFCGGYIRSPTNGAINNTSTNRSVFSFDGTANHDVPTNASMVFHDLIIDSAKIATLDGSMPSSQILGDLKVGSTSTLALALQTLASTKDVNNAGTITADGALTVGDSLVNSGTISQIAAIIAMGNITNSGTFNASTNIDANGNFTNTGTITSTGCNINLAGNWNNTGGTYTYSVGDVVTLDGTGTQTLDGNTTWNNLTVNHTGTGVSFASGMHNIDKLFDINTGAVTNSGANIVLVSSPSSTAQMPDIGTGSYSGNMTVERYIAKTGQSFTSLTSPVTGTSLATWSSNAAIGSDSLIFSGFAGSDYPSFSFINTWFYNEAIHGTAKNNGWIAATGMSDGVGASNNYKGVYIYMDAVNYKLSATGTPTTGTVTIPLGYTASGASTENGWNLVGNPYPCTVDWELIIADAANVGNVLDGYLVYSGEYANYSWYDGALNTGSGGATKDIPSSQGIWLQSLNGTALTVKESMKNTTDAGFLKTTTPPNMRILLTGSINSFQDEALIFSDASFNDAFELGDITKFLTMNPDKAPTLFTKSTDGVDLAFNKVGVNSISIPLAATAGTLAQGIYSLDFAIGSDFMPGACITLEDLHTGAITDLRTDTSYSYTTSDTTTLPRFVINITKGFNAEVSALSCYGTADGIISINGNGISGSSFSLLDGSGNIITTGTASNDSLIFNNVSGGTYEVSTTYSGACSSNNTLSITVPEPMQVTADFSLMQDTLYLDQNDILEVTNNSSGTNFAWDFGDGNTSTFVNPTHTYVSPGVYPVMLTSNNDNVGQCTEVTTKNVVVMSAPLSIEEVLNDNSTKAYVRKGYIVVEFDLENETELEIVLIDINGKKITNTLEYISSGRIDLISTDVLANGVYIVNIIGNNKTISKKLIIE